MGIIHEKLERYKDRKKLEQDVKKIEKELGAMTPEEKQKFVDNMQQNLGSINVILKNMKDNNVEFDPIKFETELSDELKQTLFMTTTMLFAVGCSISVGVLTNEPKLGFACLPLAEFLCTYTSYGVLVGIEKRPLKNLISKLQKKPTRKMNHKFKKKAKLLNCKNAELKKVTKDELIESFK